MVSNLSDSPKRGRPRKTDTPSSTLDRVESALRSFDDLPDLAHVRLPVVQALYGCSASAVWRNVNLGHIPKPIKLLPNLTAWRVGDLRLDLQGRLK